MMRKFQRPLLALALACAAGCQAPAQSSAPARQSLASRSVLDVHGSSRPAARAYASPQRVAPPEEPQLPMVTSTPAPTQTPAFAANSPRHPSADATAANYTVKRGDTLFRIAKARYGDGKRWKQIASANPGVSPSTLKAGQVLVIP